MLASALLTLALQRPSLVPGLYSTDRGRIYLALEAEPPASRVVQYFDPQTRRTGILQPASGNYETTDTPVLTYTLSQPLVALKEHRFTVADKGGKLGVSIW